MRTIGSLLLVCVLGLSCSAAQKQAAEQTSASLGKIQLPPSVAKNAIAVAHFRVGHPVMEMMAGFSYFGEPNPAQEQKLIDELSGYLKEKAGLEVSKLSRVTFVLAGTTEPLLTVILEDTSGALKGEAAGEYSGVALVGIDSPGKVVAAQLGSATLVGNLDGVKAAIDAHGSKNKRLSDDSVLGKLLAKHGTGAAMVVAVDAKGLPAKLSPIAERMGVQSAVATVGSQLRVVLQGQNEKLLGLQGIINMFSNALVQQLQNQLDQAKEHDEPAVVVGSMIGLHHMRRLVAALEPKLDGDTLTMETRVEVGNPAVVVAMIGVLAAVAIPQFMKYVKKSKTTEAKQNVHRLAQAIEAHAMETGKMPAPVGPTPPLGACCEQDGGKCLPDAKLWQHPTWLALGFSMDDPHYYSYSIETTGNEFAVRAQGDLDCDGVLSNFETRASNGKTGANLSGSIDTERELE